MDLKNYSGEDRIVSSHELAERLGNMPSVLVPTGISLLDNIIGGAEEGELIVVTGPSGEGKTTLLMSITKNIKEPSAWFTLEVTPKQFIRKMKSHGELPLFYLPNENTKSSMDWVEERIVESVVKFQTKVVFIDHVHSILSSARYTNNVSLEIGEMVQRVKDIAIKHNLIIYLIAHCKDNTTNPQAEIRKEDIRDSGMIVRIADTVLGVWRVKNGESIESKRRPLDLESDDTQAKLRVLKNRRTGTLGAVMLWHKDHYLSDINPAYPYV